jgi:AGZA family xanthine/uracil permease-like MFS transporter
MLDKLFKLKENGTNIRTEIVAGITTFMTMAYILFLNPSILSVTGMDTNAIFFAEPNPVAQTVNIASVFCLLSIN